MKEALPRYKDMIAMQKEILGSMKERVDQKKESGLNPGKGDT